jgi:hypothetical protein
MYPHHLRVWASRNDHLVVWMLGHDLVLTKYDKFNMLMLSPLPDPVPRLRLVCPDDRLLFSLNHLLTSDKLLYRMMLVYDILSTLANFRAASRWCYWFAKDSYKDMIVDILRSRRCHVIGFERTVSIRGRPTTDSLRHR